MLRFSIAVSLTFVYVSCNRTHQIAVTKRRRVLKLRAVTVMGGSCAICGYNKHPGVLDFHHVDPFLKAFAIGGGGFSRSWTSIENKLKKCILVCTNCHREIELGLHKKEVIEQNNCIDNFTLVLNQPTNTWLRQLGSNQRPNRYTYPLFS
jgi:hypothetical protein